MSKPYTETDFSAILDSDLNWRRKELSDLKTVVKEADEYSKPVLLRAIVTMSYAHWEGYVRTCANRYFEHLTLRRKRFADFERQIYVNSFLGRLDVLHQSRLSLKDRCKIVNDILDGGNGKFSYVNPDLVDTRSNLNAAVVSDICMICGVDPEHFMQNRTFLDILLLKRRNAIAHGQQEYINVDEIDDFVANVLTLMGFFRTLLENKVYTKTYAV